MALTENRRSISKHRLVKIKYARLNAKQKENYNFQKVAALMADYGFNCMRLSDDWLGADFLAYHVSGKETLKVQLKSRLMISKKYQRKGIHIVFPDNGRWYLIQHDHLIKVIGKTTNWLKTNSWRKKHGYSTSHPNSSLLKALEPYALG